MATPLILPAELTIYMAAELRSAWLDWLEREAGSESDVDVDGRAIDEIDGAGVQCLLSLARSLDARDQHLRIRQPSEVLRQACARLGATHLLAPAHGVDA